MNLRLSRQLVKSRCAERTTSGYGLFLLAVPRMTADRVVVLFHSAVRGDGCWASRASAGLVTMPSFAYRVPGVRDRPYWSRPLRPLRISKPEAMGESPAPQGPQSVYDQLREKPKMGYASTTFMTFAHIATKNSLPLGSLSSEWRVDPVDWSKWCPPAPASNRPVRTRSKASNATPGPATDPQRLARLGWRTL